MHITWRFLYKCIILCRSKREFIKALLNCITSACSLSALEAPAGYGKTTAVHKALDGENGTICWYTSVETVPDSSFRWMALRFVVICD